LAHACKYKLIDQADRSTREDGGLLVPQGLPLSWRSLSVRGVGGKDDHVYQPDLGSIITPWVGFKARKQAAKRAAQRSSNEAGEDMAWTKGMTRPGKKEPGLRPGERYLLKDFNGLLQPGEMMLVVGRPGSGCSTLLKSLAGLTGAYAGVEGTVQYGNLESGSKDMTPYESLVCFNSEEDVHDPNLTVGRTMDFATRNETVSETARVPGTAKEYRDKMKSDLLSAFGITHTHDTKVGDQYVRGVSGKHVRCNNH
jgi:ATP-binding cassette subfamily G (WHITE) protein 2 (SNQ2)